jgi:hypothetical protein
MVDQAQPAKEQRQVEKQQTKSGERQSVPSLKPAAPSTSSAGSQEQTPTKAPKPSPWAPSTLADILAILTLVVTGAFLFYTIKTWREMVRANDNTEKSNEQNDKNTEEALRLTRESNEETRRAMEISNRAWVLVTGVTSDVTSDGVMEVFFKFENVGRGVPAINVRSRGVVVSSDAPCTADDLAGVHARYSLNDIESSTVIGPGEDRSLLVEWPPYKEKSEAILSGRRLLYAIVVITYDDYFAKGRHTRLCARYGPTRGKWHALDTGNEAT